MDEMSGFPERYGLCMCWIFREVIERDLLVGNGVRERVAAFVIFFACMVSLDSGFCIYSRPRHPRHRLQSFRRGLYRVISAKYRMKNNC